MYLQKEIRSAPNPTIATLDFDKLVEQIATCGTSARMGVTTSVLDELLTTAGRATIRSKVGAKATPASAEPVPLDSTEVAPENSVEVEMESAEALEGQESYVRPNGDLYYGRKWGESTDVEVLRKAREADQFVMLYGVPGTGKTAMVEAAFPEELYTIMGSGDTEVSDLVGGYVQTPSGGFDWVDGVLVRAASEGKVLLIDEIGLIDPKVLSVVYGLMDGRRELVVTANPERGTVKAKEGFYVVSATNPNVAGVRLSEALLSRFAVQVEMTTDWGLAKKLGVPQSAVVASQNLSKKVENGETSWSPQMRELLAFRDLAKLFGTKWAVQNLLASAPEIDRPVASDVFTRVFGEPILPAKI
jgi:nitric oxide reductase NorQ protein